MKKLTLLSVMASLCLVTNSQTSHIQPLLTGERLPDIRFNSIINYGGHTASLAGFQKNYTRLVLLDFWHTTCIPCIKSFTKLDSLQLEFGEKMQILLVTTEDSNTVKHTLARWEIANKRKLSIPIITNDSLLSSYIRRGYNPHYAWVAPDGVLLAQTNITFINREMISQYLKTTINAVEQRGFKERDIKRNLKTN
ncbi:TlpA family protein disulfide reductase [Niabella sp. CJ426]|uniref:TlpA family protein disulfide reductase n=1 Tax=Niabella sp. CJ426 TaxID=3393740 RepID=UPI003CFF63D3